MIKIYLGSQLDALALQDGVGSLDRLAAPVQALGIPIICNDVPKIPYQF